MRLKTPEVALKRAPHQINFPIPNGPFIEIPSSQLLGYRGNETVYKAVVQTLPATFNEEPVPSFSSLDMRPRIEQLNPSPKRDSLFPESQMTVPPSWEKRPLVEILDGRSTPLVQIVPALERAILVHAAEKKAS